MLSEIDMLYNQERFDTSASLQFLRARYVDLNLSRFISRDSVLGTSEDPRTHNLYVYTSNDPLNHKDPSGHVAVVGSSSRQTATAFRNCRTCDNGRNLRPLVRLRCGVCGRTRVSHPTPPRIPERGPLPQVPRSPSGGGGGSTTGGGSAGGGGTSNVNSRITGSGRVDHKHNSSSLPGLPRTYFSTAGYFWVDVPGFARRETGWLPVSPKRPISPGLEVFSPSAAIDMYAVQTTVRAFVFSENFEEAFQQRLFAGQPQRRWNRVRINQRQEWIFIQSQYGSVIGIHSQLRQTGWRNL